MASSFLKVLILYMAINSLLFIGGVRVVEDQNLNMMNQFIDTDSYSNLSLVVASDEFVDSIPKNGTVVSKTFNLVDAIASVGRWLDFLINILFTPLGLLSNTNMPKELVLSIGVPLIISIVGGFAYFLRSGT